MGLSARMWAQLYRDEGVLCDHHDCRCEAARKLNLQGLTERAIELHTDKVRVRCHRPVDADPS